MKITRLLAVLVLVTAATTPTVATANEPPLADAGLDQSVTRGSAVYLDAGGSRDPDGTITDYSWTVVAPNGSTTTLDCIDCERAQFQPASVGEYDVTLTVTDDDRATATDTLRVEVAAGAPPSVSIAGPPQLAPGERDTFTATVSAGVASLDQVVWYADGQRHATTDVNGSAASVDQPLQFPEAGTRDVRVVAVDEDDQRGDATRTVDVTTDRSPEPPTTDPTPSDPSESESETGDTDTSVGDIVGPRIVTGGGVLDATYHLTNDATADWFLDDHHVNAGDTGTLTLSPGTHELYATPEGGGVATFPDGGRTVLADPAPDVHLERVTEEGIVTVDAYATDDLGNLQSMEVLVDGDVRASTTIGGIERRSGAGDQLTLLERLTDVAPGDRTVTVRATDSRGQTDSATRTVHVPGPPTVMNARFVNDEPLMSKHPKLDPEDYNGQFEIDVDLNGVDPEHVNTRFLTTGERYISMSSSRERVRPQGYDLTIRQNFSRVLGGKIEANGLVYWERGNNRRAIDGVNGETHTELSEPIIRLELVNAQNQIGSRGATFNASKSFDPDGSDLIFEWNDANSSDDWRGPVKQLHPRKLIWLTVTDEQGQSNQTMEILDWFTPELQTPEAQNSELAFPQDTVTYQVRTQHYELSKAVYEKEKYGKLIDFELVSAVGDVYDHERYSKDEKSGSFDQSLPEGFNEAYIYHEWNVTVPASEFLDGDQPTVTIQSTRQDESYREVELPDPRMYEQIRTSTKLKQFDVQYVEEHPAYEVRRTANPNRKDALQRMGFDVQAVEESGQEYQLEKRVKTESAQWKTVTRDFASKFRRQMFLDGATEWSSDGSSEERRQRTVVDWVWRDSRGGAGEFTGDTRRKLVEPAETRTIREYEYETHYQVLVTVEEERKQCLPFGGCQTYTVETTETRTRSRTVDYWSSRPRNPTHSWTGRTRVRTVGSAEYERQYQFRVEDTETYWERSYHVSTRKKVQDAQYEWQPHANVTSKRAVAMMTVDPDIRQAGVESKREWTLRRQDGTRERTVDSPDQLSWVVATEMTATASVEARFLPPNPGLRSDVVTKSRTVSVMDTIDRFVPTEEAKNIIREKADKTHADDY